jgi:hypothetical protein
MRARLVVDGCGLGLRAGLPFVAVDGAGHPADEGRLVVVETAARRGRGTGWIVFAAIVMILAGGNMAINGIWALRVNSQVEKSFGETLLFSSSNLDTWGWIYLIVGAVVVVAGITVFFRASFGIWVGVIAAAVQAFFAFFWIFSPYWPAALVILALDLLVIYALINPQSEAGYV